MAKTKVNLKEVRALLKDAEVRVGQKTAQAIGNKIVEMMKDRISKGISPIEGQPRFPAYKDTTKYPKQARKEHPDKRNRPVNLHLSGKFLSQLIARATPVRGEVTIGFFTSYGKTLERGHREGANGQRERPIIPEPNEQLAKSIRLAILRMYENAVRNYLSRRR